MKPCPMAKSTKENACARHGCDHWAGTHSRLCVCCAQRLGTADAMKLALRRTRIRNLKLGPTKLRLIAELNEIETAMLARLNKAGAP